MCFGCCDDEEADCHQCGYCYDLDEAYFEQMDREAEEGEGY